MPKAGGAWNFHNDSRHHEVHQGSDFFEDWKEDAYVRQHGSRDQWRLSGGPGATCCELQKSRSCLWRWCGTSIEAEYFKGRLTSRIGSTVDSSFKKGMRLTAEF